MPFREAHDVAGPPGPRSRPSGGVELGALPLDELRAAHPAFAADVADWLDPARAVDRRDLPGGPARGRVIAEIDRDLRRAWGTTRPTMTSEPFEYRGDELCCEAVAAGADRRARSARRSTSTAAASSSAPTSAFDAALDGIPHRVCYAVKANASLGILDVLVRLGAGADIVSAGELLRWLKAGGDPAKVVFSGVGKTRGRDEAALEAGIGTFNVESAEELDVIDRVARAARTRARIALRVNPDVDPETHPYISTGLKQNKFGVVDGRGPRAVPPRHAARTASQIVGVDCHIGSQLTKTSPFSDAIARLIALVERARRRTASRSSTSTSAAASASTTARANRAAVAGGVRRRPCAARSHRSTALGITLCTEPGRVIVGHAGALITRVLYRKRNEAKHFTIVDAAMNDLMRPALYGSYPPDPPGEASPGRARDHDRRRRADLRDRRLLRARSRAARARSRASCCGSAPPARTARRWPRTTTRGRAPPRSS